MKNNQRWMLCMLCVVFLCTPLTVRGEEILPRHMTPATVKSIQRGLDYLAKQQTAGGSFQTTQDGSTYPVSMTSLAGIAFLANGNTPSRGPYADQVRKATEYVLSQAQENGLIAAGSENGRPMYGHGFSLLFLSSVFGMETDAKVRARIAKVVKDGIQLTSSGQSNLGGWIYTPGGGDEGSVTVTQMQGLRAAHDAGFTVPKSTIQNAIKYLELCQTPEGGIRYSYHSGNDTRLPISAAAITCLYSAGEYESPLAEECMKYVYEQFKKQKTNFQSGHSFYLNLYASQAFYQAGDEYWNAYFPGLRDSLIKSQAADGSWNGDGVGPVFGTSVALIVMQLPYKYLPIYQR
ncbi:prenyltransferase/squalene oxidase repeat-containing protein [uncultured Gimesia sp.]|jgi:prenyltransferase beta subunit|uniref:prenyltransferase/squalene oxidase repeat-containing protein n=1 Tax=uncultured Gimesia sp. TaxID=1678688 RepID=UPI00262E9A6F|nr:prenyltransferase/squalene oxidase repeat-containing protein [uncultured Gimesia sp.]